MASRSHTLSSWNLMWKRSHRNGGRDELGNNKRGFVGTTRTMNGAAAGDYSVHLILDTRKKQVATDHWQLVESYLKLQLFVPALLLDIAPSRTGIWKWVGFRGSTSKPSCSFLLSGLLGRTLPGG